MRNPFRRRLQKVANGQEIRPNKGKCPGCKAPEREYCKPGCKLVDGCNPMDR